MAWVGLAWVGAGEDDESREGMNQFYSVQQPVVIIAILKSMYIKAYSSKKSHQRVPSQQQLELLGALPPKKHTLFEIPFLEDRIFTDETWFHRPGIMPHVENHRPIVKRRILRMKDDTRKSETNFKNKSSRDSRVEVIKNSYTPVISNKAQWKKQQNSQVGHNKFIAVKETIVRQMSEVPDYARNIMKPCKIQAMTISSRPLTARKTVTSNRTSKQRNSERTFSRKKQSTLIENGTINTNFLDGMYKNSTKIEPWDQYEEQFNIY